ncbi:MAG TPA: TonB family protein [Rhodopila sp.]|uniref:TonB family protein n=1 Tax=Rhodopila sp. TaxID=2480087 RepID=UPI002BE081A1|nr:TonB family protein [Rhodopila sp.]HVY16658.1 TonB family protein [Rhodopila sp.]
MRRRFRRGRLSASAVVSLLIHAAVFAWLLLALPKPEVPEELPPPSPVAMVFQSGRKEGPSVPNPTLSATPNRPKAPLGEKPSTPGLPTPATPPTPQTPPLPPPPPPPAPLPQTAFPPSAPKETAPPQPPPAAPSPPSTAAVPPVVPVPEAPLPLPPPPAPPRPQPRPVPRPAPPPAREAARPRPPANSSEFPAPENFSFGGPAAPAPSRSRPGSTARRFGSIDMTLGPAIRGVLNNAPRGSDKDGGPDWANLLSQWVAEHAYYPERARRFGEQGDAVVHVVADHFGHVKEVELIGKSGSQWLDLALVALFRDAHIPPLPTPGDDPIEFNFTMRYILVPP